MTAVEDREELPDTMFRGVESGRRVGWARAFEAERRADTAERDVNVVRSDMKIMTAFAAQAYGALEITCGKRVAELFRGVNHEVKTFFPQGQINKGRDGMRKLLGQRTDELNGLRVKIRDARAENYTFEPKRWDAAQRKVIDELVARFEFESPEQMYEWLAGHRITWEGDK